MVEETTMVPEEENLNQDMSDWTGEEETIAQVIQLIAGLSAEAQQQLMWFLTEQFSATMDESLQEYESSPEEISRKADVMSDAF